MLSDPWFPDPRFLNLRSQNQIVENDFFLENYVTSEGAVSHNVLYYQQLSITRYQVSFYANNNLYCPLPILSTAFNVFNHSFVYAIVPPWKIFLLKICSSLRYWCAHYSTKCYQPKYHVVLKWLWQLVPCNYLIINHIFWGWMSWANQRLFTRMSVFKMHSLG